MKQLESLWGRQDIREIRIAGRVFEGELLRFIYVCRRADISSFRVAVIVRKGNSTAVDRNLIKRRIREACRKMVVSTIRQPVSSLTSVSVVIMYRGNPQRPTQEVSFAGIEKDVAGFIASLRSSLVNK